MKNIISFIPLILSIVLIASSCANDDNSSSTSTDNSSSSTSLSAPTGLAVNGGANQVLISWVADVSGASSYTVYWDNATGVSSSSTAVSVSSGNSYTHTGLDDGTTYYYKVAAVNSDGTGTLSSEISATTNLSTVSVIPMDNLTIGSRTYTNAFNNAAGCTATSTTDISGETLHYTHVIKYYDNKSFIKKTLFFNDSSCTNAYTPGTTITTSTGGSSTNPYSTESWGDNISVVQLSNHFDNGTALQVYDNDNNSVDNGSMYGFIALSDNVSRAGPLLMWGQAYTKSDNEVHIEWGNWYACVFTGSDNCTSPDNFTRIQDDVAGSNSLNIDYKYSVMK